MMVMTLTFVVFLAIFIALIAFHVFVLLFVENCLGKTFEWNCGSSLYIGRVWHARFFPTSHSFNYPFFFTFIDLDLFSEAEDFPWFWWPLLSRKNVPSFARFDERDHLKGISSSSSSSSNESLSNKIRNLVEDETGKRPTGQILLLTHLKYFGYCFNPVSFYYCYGEDGGTVEAIVGEVSNTPWLEMHAYALSKDNPNVRVLDAEKSAPEGSTRFEFQKRFHVSPFMDMDHVYDWTFSPPGESLFVETSMKKDQKLWFSARIEMKRCPISVSSLLYYLTVFPCYTVIVQILIHWQAILLWRKNVPFFPHPNQKVTVASKAIAFLMMPLFRLKEMTKKRKDI